MRDDNFGALVVGLAYGGGLVLAIFALIALVEMITK